MSFSKPKRALHDYFEELFDERQTSEPTTSPPSKPESKRDSLTAKTEQSPAPEPNREARSESAHHGHGTSSKQQTESHLGKEQKTLDKEPLTEQHSHGMTFPKPGLKSGFNRPEPSLIEKKGEKLAHAETSFAEQEDALAEEQKQKLQLLLSQQALVATEPKAKLAEKVETLEQLDLKTDVAELPLEQALSTEVMDQQAGFHSAEAQTVEWLENGRPAWAQGEFDALLFDVGKLTLAVPLVSLGQIFPINDESLTPIFGQVDWFMGLLTSNNGKYRVVNTALFVMPEKYDPSFLESAEFAVSLDGVPWALAVNEVNQPIRLSPDDINWRSARSKRPWLAGTVKTQMCALLDIPAMAHLFTQADKQLRDSASDKS